MIVCVCVLTCFPQIDYLRIELFWLLLRLWLSWYCGFMALYFGVVLNFGFRKVWLIVRMFIFYFFYFYFLVLDQQGLSENCTVLIDFELWSISFNWAWWCGFKPLRHYFVPLGLLRNLKVGFLGEVEGNYKYRPSLAVRWLITCGIYSYIL